jgi:hypothetical protein
MSNYISDIYAESVSKEVLDIVLVALVENGFCIAGEAGAARFEEKE